MLPMKLHSETTALAWWLGRHLAIFWRVQPRSMALIIGALVLARFTNLASVLLPIKVLFLAGTEGMPHYFGMMADPNYKLAWIIALSMIAVGFHLVTRSLRSFSDRLCEAGSLAVMKQTNKLAFMAGQDAIGRRTFIKISTLAANLIFVALAFACLILVIPLLVICLAVSFIFEYAFTAFVLGRQTSSQNSLAIKIWEKPKDYLDELDTINFWLAFVIILIPFLVGSVSNIPLAILSFLLIRQALDALGDAIGTAIELMGQKRIIDALIIPGQQWQSSEPRADSNLHSLFEKQKHFALLQTPLAESFDNPRPSTIDWKDSPIDGVSMFSLNFPSGPNGQHYQEQVFAPHRAHLIRNEELLFTHISREVLSAPVVRANFTHGRFACRICDYGMGVEVPAEEWEARHADFLEQTWCIAPPDPLVKAYRASHPLLHESFRKNFVRRLAIAVGNEKMASTLQKFKAKLPAIRTVLSEMPLYVSTPDIVRSNTSLGADRVTYLMIWGRWSLDPIGVYLPLRPDMEKLSTMLARVRQRRLDIPEALNAHHLRLAAGCRELATKMRNLKYEAALAMLPTLLDDLVLATRGGQIKEKLTEGGSMEVTCA